MVTRCPNAPGQTTGLTLTSGNAQLAATWTAPPDNGSDIFDYDVHTCTVNCDTDSNWSE